MQLLAALDNYAKYCRSLDGEKLSATSGNTKFMIAVFNYSLKALLLRTFVPLSNSSALLQGINLSDFVQLAVQQQVHSSFKNSWQGVLIQYFIVLISSDSSNTFANDLAASLSAVYLEGVVVLSKAARGNCSPFWKQKLWKELVAQLIDNSSISGDGSPNNLKIVAVCAVATCLPLSIMQSSFDQLVTTVITAIASNGDCIGTSVSDSSTIASNSLLLLGQSVQTLEILLSINAKAFVPYLNVIIPATTNVRLPLSSGIIL